MRPRCLCRGNQVARPLAADASISGRGGRDPGPIEFARKIGELMDDDRGCAAPTAAVSAGASKTSTTVGTTPARSSIIAVSG